MHKNRLADRKVQASNRKIASMHRTTTEKLARLDAGGYKASKERAKLARKR